jgi:hypothetical protein
MKKKHMKAEVEKSQLLKRKKERKKQRKKYLTLCWRTTSTSVDTDGSLK